MTIYLELKILYQNKVDYYCKLFIQLIILYTYTKVVKIILFTWEIPSRTDVLYYSFIIISFGKNSIKN